MAKKKANETTERNYTIPLRKSTIKTARWRRAKKAISTIRAFIKRHTKAETIKIGKELNELIWERGGKRVPSKVRVVAEKDGDTAEVNLVGIEKAKPEKAKEPIKPEKLENKKENPKEEAKKPEETKEKTEKSEQ